jgi:hypothetical protein
MMRKAQPLPAIPERMHTDRFEGILPIGFGIKDGLPPSSGTCG